MISDLDLLQTVKDETSEAFVVYGDVGRDDLAGLGLLALDRANNELVLLFVSTTTGLDGAVELGIDMRTELDSRASDGAALCASCGSRIRPMGRFCSNCGQGVQAQVDMTGADPEEMRSAVRDSVSADFEFLGDMRRKEGGGRVYFAREKTSGRITALRLVQGSNDGEFELSETRVL